MKLKGSGGTEGGIGLWTAGFALAALSLWFLFDSVNVSTGTHGLFSGFMRSQFQGSFQTTSMGLIFVPFFLGVVALFYDAKWKWAWGLMYVGLGIISIEILSHIRFIMHMKSSHLLLLIVLFGAGVAMMLRSYKETPRDKTA